MKREIAAALLLVIILAVSIINTRYLSDLCNEMCEDISSSLAEAEAGRWADSENYAEKAIRCWNKNELYTHVVLRHSDIDSTTDDLYELMEHIYSEDLGGVQSSARLVCSHLNSIVDIETIKLGSVF